MSENSGHILLKEIMTEEKRKPGRPKGSKNKPKEWHEEAAYQLWCEHMERFTLEPKQNKFKQWFNKFWPVRDER